MNRRMIFYIVGKIIMLEAVLLMIPLIVSLCYHEMNCANAFSITIILAAAVGFAMSMLMKPRNKVIYAKEGFIIVTFAWIFLSILGCLPFIIAGEIPDFFDACFHPQGCRGNEPWIAVLAKLYSLAGRHGSAGAHHGYTPFGLRQGYTHHAC